MIAIDFSKQQALNDDPKAIWQINFTRNLDGDKDATMFLIIKEAKEIILGTMERWNDDSIVNLFTLMWYQYKMTQYNTLNVKISNTQLNKLKYEIKNGTEVTFYWWF